MPKMFCSSCSRIQKSQTNKNASKNVTFFETKKMASRKLVLTFLVVYSVLFTLFYFYYIAPVAQQRLVNQGDDDADVIDSFSKSTGKNKNNNDNAPIVDEQQDDEETVNQYSPEEEATTTTPATPSTFTSQFSAKFLNHVASQQLKKLVHLSDKSSLMSKHEQLQKEYHNLKSVTANAKDIPQTPQIGSLRSC